MSNSYYCNDCKKPVDLKNKFKGFGLKRKDLSEQVCKECGGTNWKAMIDSPNGYPKEKE